MLSSYMVHYFFLFFSLKNAFLLNPHDDLIRYNEPNFTFEET